MSRGTDSYAQYNRKNFEDAEFPILCETCLGSNPYIRMVSPPISIHPPHFSQH